MKELTNEILTKWKASASFLKNTFNDYASGSACYYYYLNLFTVISYITINNQTTTSSLGLLKVTFLVLQRYKKNRYGEEKSQSERTLLNTCAVLFKTIFSTS